MKVEPGRQKMSTNAVEYIGLLDQTVNTDIL